MTSKCLPIYTFATVICFEFSSEMQLKLRTNCTLLENSKIYYNVVANVIICLNYIYVYIYIYLSTVSPSEIEIGLTVDKYVYIYRRILHL